MKSPALGFVVAVVSAGAMSGWPSGETAAASSHTRPASHPAKFTVVLTGDPKSDADGNTYVFRNGDAQGSALTIQPWAPEIDLAVGGRDGGGAHIEIAPPPGEKLRPGFYPGAVPAGFQDEGEPGLTVAISRGCNDASGWFDVKDVKFSETGAVRRLWATFEHHCEEAWPGTYGEVRIGRSARSLRSAVLPDRPWFLDTEVGSEAVSASVYYVSVRGRVRVQDLRLRGPHRSDFSLEADTCSGARLTSGQRCGATLGFAPGRGGPRYASVLVRGAERRDRARVEAMVIPGRSSVSFEWNRYDGTVLQQEASVDRGHTISSWFYPSWGIRGIVEGGEPEWMWFEFHKPGGVTEGVTYRANDPDAEYAEMYAVSSCTPGPGTFTVDRLGVRPNGLGRFHQVSFDHHCAGGGDTFTGTFGYRVPTGEVEPPAPVTNLKIQRRSRRASVRWQQSPSGDVAYYVVRYSRTRSAPATPLLGYHAYVGQETEATIRRPRPRLPLSVAVFPVDEEGNIGDPATKTTPGARRRSS